MAGGTAYLASMLCQTPAMVRPGASPFAVRGVLLPVAAVAVALTVLSGRYGYHRDELYFRMLPPAWGYVDQPPLLPLLANALGSSPWLLRIPATVCAAASVALIAAVARELGAAQREQAWAAWAYAGTVAVLDFGHILLTSAIDLAGWPLICWLVIRAELRDRPRLWLVAGVIAGLLTYVKLLVVVLLIAIAVGLALTRPRRLMTGPVLGGAALAALVGLPNLIYQAANGFPQLAMGRALSQNNSGEVRWFAWVFLIIALGPFLVPIWLRGLHALWTMPGWRPVRFLTPAFAVLVAFTVISGAQPHYPTFMLGVIFAAGVAAMPTAGALHRPAWRIAVAVNATVAAVVSLPLVPLGALGSTPIPGMNQLTADQVGWPRYAAQIRAVHQRLPPQDRATAVVLTSNYGEAGAIARFTDLPVFSGHNALGDLGPPPEPADPVIMVGGQVRAAGEWFAECRIVAALDNLVDVDNEEQGEPIAVCTGPREPWSRLWSRVRHLD